MSTADVRKAAVVLVSLPERAAARLLACLSPGEQAAVALAIAALGNVAPEERAAALAQFCGAGESCGGPHVVRRLLSAANGCEAAASMLDILAEVERRPFAVLRRADPRVLAALIEDEHPQTMALVVSCLPDAQAAALVGHLPDRLRAGVVERVATMGAALCDAIAEVEAALVTRVRAVAGSCMAPGGPRRAAAILDACDAAVVAPLVAHLDGHDPRTARLLAERRTAGVRAA